MWMRFCCHGNSALKFWRRKSSNRMSGRGRLDELTATLLVACAGLFFVLTSTAGPLLPPAQVGNLLEMTNNHVCLEYNLSTGRANFYWQNSLKISGFYAGVDLQ